MSSREADVIVNGLFSASAMTLNGKVVVKVFIWGYCKLMEKGLYVLNVTYVNRVNGLKRISSNNKGLFPYTYEHNNRFCIKHLTFPINVFCTTQFDQFKAKCNVGKNSSPLFVYSCWLNEQQSISNNFGFKYIHSMGLWPIG